MIVRGFRAAFALLSSGSGLRFRVYGLGLKSGDYMGAWHGMAWHEGFAAHPTFAGGGLGV